MNKIIHLRDDDKTSIDVKYLSTVTDFFDCEELEKYGKCFTERFTLKVTIGFEIITLIYTVETHEKDRNGDYFIVDQERFVIYNESTNRTFKIYKSDYEKLKKALSEKYD